MNERDTVRVLASRAAAGRISRRGFLSGALVAGLGSGFLLSGCGSKTDGATSGDGKLSGQLNMYSWGEYDDPQVLKDFTAKHGPKLQIDAYGSNEEMIAKLVAAGGTSGFDIVVPTGTFIPQMAQNGLLEELDLSGIPNFANIQSEFADQSWDPGNKHSICKAWGTTGYVYDSTKITRELKTWADFLDAAQNEAAGETTVVDDPKEIVGIPLFANGHDVNTTDEKLLDEAEKILVDQLAPNVKVFDSYPGGGAMSESSAILLQAWNGDARQGILEDEDGKWKWVLPSDGSNIWMDNWSIVKGAKNIDAAYAFIDYVLQPDVSLTELAYNGYHTGVKDIEASAEAEGLEMLDLVFLTEQQLAGLTAMTVNEAQQRIVDMVSAMKAKAGA
jgi:spermidine/putrescine transport system substrate-binding protein